MPPWLLREDQAHLHPGNTPVHIEQGKEGRELCRRDGQECRFVLQDLSSAPSSQLQAHNHQPLSSEDSDFHWHRIRVYITLTPN